MSAAAGAGIGVLSSMGGGCWTKPSPAHCAEKVIGYSRDGGGMG
jgi:hypothetical protein